MKTEVKNLIFPSYPLEPADEKLNEYLSKGWAIINSRYISGRVYNSLWFLLERRVEE